jgi:hypothetical protein
MSFMQRQVTGNESWLQVETTNCTTFLPSDLVSGVSNCPAEEVEDNIWFESVQQYCEGEPQSWEWIKGYGARLSAPGYMDCTEWAVFETEAEAMAYLDEYYPEDEETDEDGQTARW